MRLSPTEYFRILKSLTQFRSLPHYCIAVIKYNIYLETFRALYQDVDVSGSSSIEYQASNHK